MTDVVAMAGISAAEREIVETVRVHILPMDETEFIALDGSTLVVGGPDLVPGYHATIVADMEARGSTYIPQLVDHGECPDYYTRAVGMVREAQLDDAGIWLVVDLWSEGVEARYGRDFVSAGWQFGGIQADGRPTTARIIENSFTSTPQFSLAQSAVSELETASTELFPISATMKTLAQQPKEPDMMTIEDIKAAMLADDEFADAFAERLAARATAETEDDPEDALEAEADAESEPEGEAVAAMEGEHDEDKEEVDATEVAASAVLKRLDEMADRLERMENAETVKASLRGTKATTPTTPDVPAEFGARVLHFRNQGYDRASAVKAAQNYKGA